MNDETKNSDHTRKDVQDQTKIYPIPFRPVTGLSSPHAQTVIACFTPGGDEPPSEQVIVPLDDGDALCCEVSTPPSWSPEKKTILLLHGMGGCHTASYMVRLSRKLYELGYRAVRINMRSCGSGKHLARVPYHGGLSSDILHVLEMFKKQTPSSPVLLVGFSLGGNIALKLAGELGRDAGDLLKTTLAVCPPVDLADTAALMCTPKNRLYNLYYMRQLEKLAEKWTKGKPFSTIYEFDEIVTAPNWGFKDPAEYYEISSSKTKLQKIHHPCHILFARDDPFVNYKICTESKLSPDVSVWIAPKGGHMGFFGWTEENHKFYWMDSVLLRWIEGHF